MIGRHFIFLVSVMMLSHMQLHGQEKIKYSLGAAERDFSLTVTEQMITGKISFPMLSLEEVSEDNQSYIRIRLPGAFKPGIPGPPELPVLSRLIELPEDPVYSIEIVTLDSIQINLEERFPGMKIFPTQVSAQKDGSQISVFHRGYTAEDISGTHYGEPLMRLNYEGKMREVSLGNLQFTPFRYNPGENLLTVFYNAEFKIHFPGQEIAGNRDDIGSTFQKLFKDVALRKKGGELKRLIEEQPITMLILSDTLFRDTLQSLIDWKKQKGFRIIEAYTSDPEVGETYTDIREYMHEQYTDPPEGFAPPSYLLIVGDVEHVPLSQPSGQITDLYYTTFDGPEDYLPEMFHGRISVKTEQELADVIDKILMYEKFEFPDPSFLNRTILIAGYDGIYAAVHGNGQINYAAQYYFNQSNGIDANVYLHPEASSQDLTILNDISQGAALVNYTGHGEYYGWLDPAFRQHHVDTLKNTSRFGLMIGNGCSTNQFNLSGRDCFAESVVKVKDRGAVGYIGCTNDSYWDEDYYWAVGVGPFVSTPLYEETSFGYYDKVFHQGAEDPEDWSPSMGEMIYAGNMTVQQSTSTKKKYYWEIYQLMGDPSLVPWFKVPEDAPVYFPRILPASATVLNLTASSYDYVALSSDGELINAKHANASGQVQFILPEGSAGQALQIVVSGDKRQPHIDSVVWGETETGFLEILDYELKLESVKEDEILSPGERFSLELLLVNRGTNAVPEGNLELSCIEPFVEILDSMIEFTSIAPGDSLKILQAFDIQLDPVYKDLNPFTLKIARESGGQSNDIFLLEKIHSPVLVSTELDWEDRSYGNGNGIIEEGEKIRFIWNLSNTGSYDSDSIQILADLETDTIFSSFSPFQQKGISSKNAATLNPTAVVADELIKGLVYQVPLDASSGHYMLKDSISLVIGRHFEDFSSADLSTFNWMNSENGWRADSISYSGSPYSFRSGSINHNASSSLSIEIMVGQADSVCFDYRVSSEASYDFLRFFVDSVQLDKWSGELPWQNTCFELEPGKRLLEWRYQKDQNTIRGQDAAWIDNIIFPENAFDSLDLGIRRLIAPRNGKSLSNSEAVQLLIANTGKDSIMGFSAAYSLNGGEWHEEIYQDTLLSGQEKLIEFPNEIDLSEIGEYLLHTRIESNGDAFPGNDSISFMVNHYVYPDLALQFIEIDSISEVYADILMEVSNQGNQAVDQFSYAYYLDNEFRRTDSADLSLGINESIQIAVRLIDASATDIEKGMHQFRIIAEADSLIDNNQIEGEVSWFITSYISQGNESIRIYPNPAGESFVVSMRHQKQWPLTIDFYSASGKRIHSSETNESIVRFNTSEVFREDGIYLLVIRDTAGRQISHGKIMVSKYAANK